MAKSYDMGYQEMYIAGKFNDLSERFYNLAERKYREFCSKFCTPLDQEEVVQECMEVVAKSLKEYEIDTGVHLYTFVERNMTNRISTLATKTGTYKAKQRSRHAMILDVTPDEEDAELMKGGAVVGREDVEFEIAEYRLDLYNRMGLTESERDVLNYKEYGYAHKEIARLLNRSEGWVSQKVSSAREKWDKLNQH